MMRRKKAVMVSSIWISDVPLRIALKFRFISGLWAIAVPGKRPDRHEAGWGWLGSALMPSFLMCPPLRDFHFPACRAATLKR